MSSHRFGSYRGFHPSYTHATPANHLAQLLHLMDEITSPRAESRVLPTFQPKFDVRETTDAYELHGELAGLDKKDVHIELTDPQTIQVRGHIERAYQSGTPPAGVLEDDAPRAAITESAESGSSTTTKGHSATVQDETEAEREENGQLAQQQTQHVADRSTDTAKYWVSERSIGEFSRNFPFPERLDGDAITASFKNGILHVVVPKAKKHESRRITIN